MPKSGRKLPRVGYRWLSREERVAWGQQLEVLSVLDLKEHCSYPIHGRLQPAAAASCPPSTGRTRASGCIMRSCTTSPSSCCRGSSSSWTPTPTPRPTILFATVPEMAPEQIYRTCRDRFPSEFNFRDAKQHLGLTACQARTAARHHFHVKNCSYHCWTLRRLK